jgi:hypothetical protein
MFTDMLTAIEPLFTHSCVLIGDFNFPDIDWSTLSASCGTSRVFINFATSHDLTQLVTEPTRGNNLLDLVLINNPSILDNVQVSTPFSVADHCSILFPIKSIFRLSSETEPLTRFNFANGNYDAILQTLCSINWTVILNDSQSADDAYGIFVKTCHELIENHVPKMIGKEANQLPFYLQRLSRQVDIAHKNRSRYGIQRYHKLSRKLRRDLFQHRLEIEQRVVLSGNVRQFYRYCNKSLKATNSIGNLISNGNIVSGDEEKAEIFADYFETFYCQPSPNSGGVEVEESPLSFEWIDITPDRVLKTLQNLPLRVSTSPDNLPYYFLRKAALGLASPLTILFNKFLLTGSLPELWKIGLVRPIFKKGARNNVENYRPVCLTSGVCKTMERIVVYEINQHLRRNNLLPPQQHGFLSRRATSSALLTAFNDWHKAIDSKRTVYSCFVDYSKAFDRINHVLLAKKLTAVGIKGCLLRFCVEFLNGRSQIVKVGSKASRQYATPSGVPQGSCLGPQMFVIFNVDLPSSIPEGVSCCQYADDTKLYAIDNPARLQEGIDALNKWANKWELPVNVNKTFIFILGKTENVQFTLNGLPLTETNEITDLGLTYSNKLTFTTYVDRIVKKATGLCNFILRGFATRNVEILAKLYKVYVRPNLEYCTQIWSPDTVNGCRKVEKVQSEFTLKCFKRLGLSRESYDTRMERMGLQSLEKRRQVFDYCTMYKLVYGLVDLKFADLFAQSNRANVSRTHRFIFIPPIVKTQRFKSFFTNRVLPWNQFSSEIVYSGTLKTFKNRINKHFTPE